MLSQITLIHLVCSAYCHKTAKEFLLLHFFAYHTNKQIAYLADGCIFYWIELLYEIPHILRCENLQQMWHLHYVVLTLCHYQSQDT